MSRCVRASGLRPLVRTHPLEPVLWPRIGRLGVTADMTRGILLAAHCFFQAYDRPKWRLSTCMRRPVGRAQRRPQTVSIEVSSTSSWSSLAGRTSVLRGFHGYARKLYDLTRPIAMLTALGTHTSNHGLGLTQQNSCPHRISQPVGVPPNHT